MVEGLAGHNDEEIMVSALPESPKRTLVDRTICWFIQTLGRSRVFETEDEEEFPVVDTRESGSVAGHSHSSPAIDIHGTRMASGLLFLQGLGTGDCFIVSTLYAFKHSPFGSFLIEKFVEEIDGDYAISLPGFPCTIYLFAKELEGQWDKDQKVFIGTLRGDKKLQACERAIARMLNKQQLRSGLSPVDKSMEFVNTGGCAYDVMNLLFGGDLAITDYLLIPEGTEKIPDDFEKFALMFASNTQRCIAIAGSRNTTEGNYLDKKKLIPREHDFAIRDIDLVDRTITLVNPHDTANESCNLILTFKMFFKYFRNVQYACLNTEAIKDRFPREEIFSPVPHEECPYNEKLDIQKEYICHAPTAVKIDGQVLYDIGINPLDPNGLIISSRNYQFTQQLKKGGVGFLKRNVNPNNPTGVRFQQPFSRVVKVENLGKGELSISVLDPEVNVQLIQ